MSFFLQEKGFKYLDYYVKVFAVFCQASQLIVWFTKTSKILSTYMATLCETLSSFEINALVLLIE